MTYNTTRDNVRGAKKISSGKNNSKLQIKRIISIDKLLENIENGEEFVERYGTNQTFENFSDPCYNQTFKNTFKNFSNSCYFISKNRITSATIANFVNGGAKLLNQKWFLNEIDADKFKEIATKIGQLIVNGTIKLNTFNSQAIANTFNGLAQCYVDLDRYVDDTFIKALVDKIQNLLNKFNSIDIANTFNGLAKCGVNLGEYFETTKDKGSKDAFIKALVNMIQDLLNDKQFTSQELANTFNGLGQCGINLGGYVNNEFIRALVDKIKTLLKEFNSIGIANTFNGLAKCGVNLGKYFETKENEKNKFIEALVGEIQTLLSTSNFKSQELANTFNGLAKCGVNLGRYLNNLSIEVKNDFIKALVGRIQNLLEDFNSIDIANTFNGLGQCGVDLGEYLNKPENKYLKNDFIGALVGKIQILLKEKENYQKQFTSQELANTFNGLAQCGVNLGKYFETAEGKGSKDTFIEALVNMIQDLLNDKQFEPQHIANTFNGLAQCGVNLGEYFETTEGKKLKDAFIKALVNMIQDLLNDKQFTSQELANTFNGLAQCGVNLGEYFETTEGKKLKDTFIKALVVRIRDLLPRNDFNSQAIANTFNGLVKLFLYNEDLYRKNISQFENIINILVQKYFEQLNRDDRSDWAMLYNIKYLQACGFKINDEILFKIQDLNLKLDALNNDHTNSALEENFKAFLIKFGLKNETTEMFETKDGYYELESKLTFQVTSYVSFKRLIDFYIEFIQDNKTYKAYIELDGPTHFTDTEQTQKTPQTQIRDILTLQQLQKEQATLSGNNNTQILYVTLSANEFNKIKKSIKTKKDLLDFLTEKNQLKQITEKTSDNSKMAVEYKSIYDSVNDVASKTMDIDDYTTPTPGQAVSELAQKAQQDDGWITVKSNYKGKPKDKKTKTKTKSRKISIK